MDFNIEIICANCSEKTLFSDETIINYKIPGVDRISHTRNIEN